MNKINLILICISCILFSCSRSNLTVKSTSEHIEHALLQLDGVELDTIYIEKRNLHILFTDTSSYFSVDYSNLFFAYCMNLFHQELSFVDTVNFQLSYSKLGYNYKLKVGLSEFLPFYQTFKSNPIYDSLICKLLFGLNRKEYVQLEYSVKMHNNLFLDYNYHETLSGMILNCVQHCDTTSMDYRAMKSVALVSINTNKPNQMELFSIITNYCQGRTYNKNDVTDFHINKTYLDSLSHATGSKRPIP